MNGVLTGGSMKTKLIITLAVLGFAALIGIRIATYQPEDEVDIEDALAISAYVYDDTATPDKLVGVDSPPMSLTQLELGVRRYTAFVDEMENINLRFDFDGGTIEVASEAPVGLRGRLLGASARSEAERAGRRLHCNQSDIVRTRIPRIRLRRPRLGHERKLRRTRAYTRRPRVQARRPAVAARHRRDKTDAARISGFAG